MRDETYRPIGNLEDQKYYKREEPEQSFSNEEIQLLRDIVFGVSPIKLTVDNTYEDDHEICAQVTLNGLKLDFTCITSDFFAAVVYAGKDSIEAQKRLIGYIEYYLDRVED